MADRSSVEERIIIGNALKAECTNDVVIKKIGHLSVETVVEVIMVSSI